MPQAGWCVLVSVPLPDHVGLGREPKVSSSQRPKVKGSPVGGEGVQAEDPGRDDGFQGPAAGDGAGGDEREAIGLPLSSCRPSRPMVNWWVVLVAGTWMLNSMASSYQGLALWLPTRTSSVTATAK